MVYEISTVATKGQVTIPKSVRDALGIEEKDQLLKEALTHTYPTPYPLYPTHFP
jgi:AbrB family looped-hinge helix DNA binding protein